jgi:hypothetical protein
MMERFMAFLPIRVGGQFYTIDGPDWFGRANASLMIARGFITALPGAIRKFVAHENAKSAKSGAQEA